MIKIITNFIKRLIAFTVIVIFLLGMIPVALIAFFFLDSHKEYPRVSNAFNSLEGFVLDLYKWAKVA